MRYFIAINDNNVVLDCQESAVIPSPRHFEITADNFNVYVSNRFKERCNSGEIINVYWFDGGTPEESRFGIQVPPNS